MALGIIELLSNYDNCRMLYHVLQERLETERFITFAALFAAFIYFVQ